VVPGRLGISGGEIDDQTRNLVLAKDILFAVDASSGVASVIQGRALTRQAPATPIASGTTPSYGSVGRHRLARSPPSRRPRDAQLPTVPPGPESDPDVLVLRRQGGAFVAAFSAQGATREGILDAAKDEHEA
jgi:hypothetical protein